VSQLELIFLKVLAMTKTYLLIGEEQRGPYSDDELQDLFAAGAITAETPSRKEDLSDWQALGSLGMPAKNIHAVSTTIAPPRRTQQTEKSGTYLPVDYREKSLKGQNLSARMKPITLLSAIGLFILFLIILTTLIFILGHFVPDIAKEFQEAISAVKIIDSPWQQFICQMRMPVA